jgi:predicted protein tyrosine phosphatase
MSFIRLTICRVGEVNALLKANKYDAIVSIKDPTSNRVFQTKKTLKRQRQLQKHAPHVLCLDFTDDDTVDPSIVAALIEFANQIPIGSSALVHCMAGISRSTAASTILLCEKGASLDEALAEVKRVRDCAAPNAKMLQLYSQMRSTETSVAVTISPSSVTVTSVPCIVQTVATLDCNTDEKD